MTQDDLVVQRALAVLAPPCHHYYPFTIASGKGSAIMSSDGRRFLDFTSGLAVLNLGHNHPRVVDAVREQLGSYVHTGGIYYSETTVAAAEELISTTPSGLDMLFFGNSGAEAVEGALKLARFASGRQAIISCRGAFHGRTLGALSVTSSSSAYRRRYHPLLPSVYQVSYPACFNCPCGLTPDACGTRCLDEISRVFEHQVPPEEVCAIIIEPFLGEGGYYPAPRNYLRGLRAICDEYGILLIFDEVQSGIGRTGKWFCCEHAGVVPDILTVAKALASGFPLSAVVASKELMLKWDPSAHGTTFGGNAVSCAAARATLQVIREEALLDASVGVGARTLTYLQGLALQNPTHRRREGDGVHDRRRVRGRGRRGGRPSLHGADTGVPGKGADHHRLRPEAKRGALYTPPDGHPRRDGGGARHLLNSPGRALMKQKQIVIMGAAGRDFHNFNVCFRDNPAYLVRAFTATQIPFTAGRNYPPALAGSLYPDGIPILDETLLPELLKNETIDEVVFAYSDVSHEALMHKGSAILACGADFRLIGPRTSMLQSTKPVISICAVRTGCGKSGLSRRICAMIAESGLRPVVVRHPMPYGDLELQAVQRFQTLDDLKRCRCTLEEREEYEPHLAGGFLVFAGVDYAGVLAAAEAEGDVIVWDGGNNDFPFLRPDLELTLLDPTRAGDETSFFPGEVNLLRADVLILNKCNLVSLQALERLTEAVRERNPRAAIVRMDSSAFVEERDLVTGRRVLVVEDGPSITHGGLAGGAGLACARALGADVVDPRPFAVGSLRKVYEEFPHLGPVLPALGYSEGQLAELAQTVARVPCDLVLSATPADLAALIPLRSGCCGSATR